jgi:hypothetical protein
LSSATRGAMLEVEVRDVALVMVTLFLIVLAVLIAVVYLVPESASPKLPQDRWRASERPPRAPRLA